MIAWYIEAKVADRVGHTRQHLKGIRDESLKKNSDWKVLGRDVVLSAKGLVKLLERLELLGIDCSSALVEKNGEVAPAEPEFLEVTVTRVFPNPRLLLAVLPETNEGPILVSVPNNVNFRPAMKVKVRQPTEPPPAPQLYRLEGRCPRFPGRW